MLKDRGTMKWISMMLPEHVHMLKEAIAEENKLQKPMLDEQAIAEFEAIIYEAMEQNYTIIIEIFNNGVVETLKGTVHFIDYVNGQLSLKNEKGFFLPIPFNNLVSIVQE